MAVTAAVSVKDFLWFREILVRAGDLALALQHEDLSPDAARALRTFTAALRAPDSEMDSGRSDLFAP